MEKANKLLTIRDFITSMDEDGNYSPTKEDVRAYVNACSYDTAYDDAIKNKRKFEKEMQKILNDFIKFIKEI